MVIEVGRGTRKRLRELPLKVLGGLVSNPVLWGLLRGIAVNLAGLRCPARSSAGRR